MTMGTAFNTQQDDSDQKDKRSGIFNRTEVLEYLKIMYDMNRGI